jgi:hypothetical protein
MPSFSSEIPHNLGKEQAVGRIRRFTEFIRERYKDQVSHLEESWSGENSLNFSFKTFGFELGGKITVEDEAVKLAGELPIAALPFKGKIEKEFREQLSRVLT